MSRSLSGRDRVRLVAAREIRERVRARSFQITTVLVALAVAAAIVIPNLGDEGPDTVRLGQVGTPTAETRETAEAAARLAGLRVELVTLPNTGAAEGALRADDVDLALLERGEASGLELVANDRPDEDSELGHFTAAVSQSLGLRSQLQQAGLKPDVAGAALRAPPIPLRALSRHRPRSASARRGRWASWPRSCCS